LHGFLYDGRTWTTLDDPQAEPGSFGVGGTVALGIDGASIVGIYIHSDGIYNAFLASPIPRLAITRSSNSLRVSWPCWGSPWTGWTLEQTPDLTSTNWTPSGGAANDGTNNFLDIAAPAGNLFFRLSQQ
jgi:hypothetical protein